MTYAVDIITEAWRHVLIFVHSGSDLAVLLLLKLSMMQWVMTPITLIA